MPSAENRRLWAGNAAGIERIGKGIKVGDVHDAEMARLKGDIERAKIEILAAITDS